MLKKLTSNLDIHAYRYLGVGHVAVGFCGREKETDAFHAQHTWTTILSIAATLELIQALTEGVTALAGGEGADDTPTTP
jgi:hypothetical protein